MMKKDKKAQKKCTQVESKNVLSVGRENREVIKKKLHKIIKAKSGNP